MRKSQGVLYHKRGEPTKKSGMPNKYQYKFTPLDLSDINAIEKGLFLNGVDYPVPASILVIEK